MGRSLADQIAEDRKIGAEITHAYVEDPQMERARSAAARHNARLDMPVEGKRGRWSASASGVTVDAQQTRHPWTVTAAGNSADEALEELIVQLGTRPVATIGLAVCPTCGQPLPEPVSATPRTDAPG